MNERIKQLAEQAGILSKPRQLGPAPVIQPGVLNPLRKYVSDEEHIQDNIDVVRAVLGSNGCNGLEKFSELIVRDCAEFIAPLGDYCGGHGEPSAPSSRECARRLKQHFGVGE